MSHLIAAEMLRVKSRRSTWWVLIFLCCLTAVHSLISIDQVRPLTDQDWAIAASDRAEIIAENQQWLADCSAKDVECSAEASLWEVDDVESFLRQVFGFEEFAAAHLDPYIYLLGIAVVLVWAAETVAADYRDGALATQLTFTPRRIPLLLAQALSVWLCGMGIVVASLVVSLASSMVAFAIVNTPAEISAGRYLADLLWREFVASGLFLLVAVFLSQLLHSGTRSIIVAGLVMIGSMLLEQDPSIFGLQISPVHILPSSQVMAMVLGSYTVYGPDEPEPSGAFVSETLDFTQAVVYFCVVVLVLGVAAAWRFHRRDITR